ncbi:MAG: GNAT family N-acetyltransferase [Acidimicrobiales bacterium]
MSAEGTSDSGRIAMVGARSGLEYRRIQEEWADRLEQLEREVFAPTDPGHLCRADEFAALARLFPEGNFAGFDGDRIVALGIGIRRPFDFDDPIHRQADVAADLGAAHTADGAWYYGTTIGVLPAYRARGIGDELYQLRKGVCRELGLQGIVAGGMIPGYAGHRHALSAPAYIEAVVRGDLRDPTLTFQLNQGFEVVCPLPDYLHNPEVGNWAVLIRWLNPDR